MDPPRALGPTNHRPPSTPGPAAPRDPQTSPTTKTSPRTSGVQSLPLPPVPPMEGPRVSPGDSPTPPRLNFGLGSPCVTQKGSPAQCSPLGGGQEGPAPPVSLPVPRESRIAKALPAHPVSSSAAADPSLGHPQICRATTPLIPLSVTPKSADPALGHPGTDRAFTLLVLPSVTPKSADPSLSHPRPMEPSPCCSYPW